ncbi:MAG TPA: hypothetical protein DHW70_01075 [Candidatus Atribacteria bacterium]|nr:hypothetical protein [Candidatus Atribacteria bacterium]
MPKIPRGISGRKLTKLLEKYGYKIIRESASHKRLISKYKDKEHKITIPDHNPIKIGTLNNILIDSHSPIRSSPLFCFNGVSPTPLSYRRVLSVLLRSAGNSIPGFVD